MRVVATLRCLNGGDGKLDTLGIGDLNMKKIIAKNVTYMLGWPAVMLGWPAVRVADYATTKRWQVSIVAYDDASPSAT
jgi:hypothetical protein